MLDDLSYEYMRNTLTKRDAGRYEEPSKLEMAKGMNLISGTDVGGYRAKNFGVLMFAGRPHDFIKETYIEVISDIADDTDRMSAETFDGPIWIQAQFVTWYFCDAIMRSYTLHSAESDEHRVVLTILSRPQIYTNSCWVKTIYFLNRLLAEQTIRNIICTRFVPALPQMQKSRAENNW